MAGSVRHATNERLGGLAAARSVPRTCASYRFEEIDVASFARIHSAGWPIVLTGAAALFGDDVGAWQNVSHLREFAGSLMVPASYFSTVDGERFGTQVADDGQRVLVGPNRMSTIDELLSFERSDRVLFAEPATIYDVEEGVMLAPLFERWLAPKFTFNRPNSVNLWAGRVHLERPKESSLHYDDDDNLLLQLIGTKTFLMYPATDAANLHARPLTPLEKPWPGRPGDQDDEGQVERDANEFIDADLIRAPVDPIRPDPDKFPLLKRAQLINCSVHPGDAIYLPSHTWHAVVSEGQHAYATGDARLNLAVSAWFTGNRRFGELFTDMMELVHGSDAPDQ